MALRDNGNPSGDERRTRSSADAARSQRQAYDRQAASNRARLAALPVITEVEAKRPAAAPSAPAAASRKTAAATGGTAVRRKRGIWNAVFYIALVVFIASLLALGFIYYSYWKERNTYSDIAVEAVDVSAKTLADLKVDWDALRARNPETVAWIYVPDTQINYPVVHTSDNDKYLKTNFQGETNWAVSVGAIFLETKNSVSFTDANSILYGHNMNDGSMFSAIVDLAAADAFNAHRNIYVLTPSGNYRIKTFALIHTSGNDGAIVQTAFGTAADLASYIQDKIDRSVVTPDGALPSVGDMSQIFTFSTCDNNQDNARYILFGYVAESTVPGVAGLEDNKLLSRNAATIVDSGSNSFAEGNDVE